VLGSSGPGVGGSNKGADSTLAMATAPRGARAGVKGNQPRAGVRERFRTFERDLSQVECTLVRRRADSFAGRRTNADLGGSVARVGFRPRERSRVTTVGARVGVEEGIARAQSARNLRSKPLGPRVSAHRKVALVGHSHRTGNTRLSFSCGWVARSRKRTNEPSRTGQLRSWPRSLEWIGSSRSCPYVGSCCRSQ